LAAARDTPATSVRVLRSAVEANTIIVLTSGPIARDDIPGLCERLRMLLESSDAELILCDVGTLIDPDVVAVDAMARLQLTARRLGRRLRLRHACEELQELLVLTGLSDIVPPCADSAIESKGQAEQREPPGGIEEEADPADPTV
jgi:ABC-type transporter Mla MlaB component